MADDLPPPPPRRDLGSAANMGWTALGYLIAGIAFWGFVGWLVDHFLLHTSGVAIGLGCIVGAAAGIYLTMRHLGA